jgi:hypothetical protein
VLHRRGLAAVPSTLVSATRASHDPPPGEETHAGHPRTSTGRYKSSRLRSVIDFIEPISSGVRRTGIAHLPEPAGRKHCRVWLAPLFIKGCSDSAEPMRAFSPTCTALHGPSISGNPRCRASRADQVLLRITPSFSAHGAAVLGCRAARAEMLSALAACNVRHAHLVRCLFGKTRSRHPCAPNAGMRCGLPASSRQCGRCLGWSSTYAEAADTSEPPNASPIPHHRSGFNRRAAYRYSLFRAGTRERQ